ncbi:MAG: sporulation protein YabP [Clostridia bacterium]|nr:sporulation protein YabP [Clostridia bacterium]
MRIRTHAVHIDNRELMSVTGVKSVESFNEQEVCLLTEVGALHIEGIDLHITKLNLDDGQVIIEGEIIMMEYDEPPQERSGVFSRLFR